LQRNAVINRSNSDQQLAGISSLKRAMAKIWKNDKPELVEKGEDKIIQIEEGVICYNSERLGR